MRPISFAPRVQIEREGILLADAEIAALASVYVHEVLNQPTLCELVFVNTPAPSTVESSLQLGTSIRVMVRDHRIPLFVGQITALEYRYEPSSGREFRVRAYDLLHRLRKNGEVRAHTQVSLADLVRELAAPHGLNVQTSEDTPQLGYVIQHRQSDLELLQELAQQYGLYLAVREDTLHLFSLNGILGESVLLTLGANLLEASLEINSDQAVGEVAAAGWNTAQIGTHTGRITSPRSSRAVGAHVTPQDVGGNGIISLLDLVVENDAQIEARAQSELDYRAASEVVFTGTADGDTRIRPGGLVVVAGVTPALNGTYMVASATHTIDMQVGYITEIDTMPPPRQPRQRGSIATPAVVTQIVDPDGLGRVRVSLPSFENVETDWINVVSLGAGGGKGLMIQPDVGDDVLVLLAHENPAQAVVIGGLYAARGTPDAGIESGAVKRYTLLTPGGQRVKLDDSGQVIRLENSDGSFVELSPEKVSVHAARDLEIEAPGKAIVIRGNTIDFQRG